MKMKREWAGPIVAIGLGVALLAALLLLAGPVRSPEARAMQCMADNGWADAACERFAGLPAGWVWP